MGLKLNDVNGAASEHTFGFKATSRSLKPVHIAQVVFNQTLGHEYDQDELFEFLERPSKTPADELDEEIRELFDFTQHQSHDELDNLRQHMRKVLANDNALYASQRGSAPTCTSDWFIISPTAGVTPGRFLHTLIQQAEGDLERKLSAQLEDHHDCISLLFRPLAKHGERSDATIKPWEEPTLGDAFGEGTIADQLVDGFATISEHLKSRNGTAINYPRDLRRIVKFTSLSLYLYIANRHNEIRTDAGARNEFFPILLNYTGDRENPVADASLSCVDKVSSEVRSTSRLGVRRELDRQGYKAYSEGDLRERIEDKDLLDINRQKEAKLEEDYQTFQDMFDADPADDAFEKLVNSVTDAIHLSRYDTYTPVDTVQTFGWRCGLLKPRGNRANRRRFRPDPEIIEAIVLSVLEPGQSMPLQEFCAELRTRYGIIVGGTPNDRDHLQEWDITVGASDEPSDPLSHRNYGAFRDLLVNTGFGREFADGVTIVSPTINK